MACHARHTFVTVEGSTVTSPPQRYMYTKFVTSSEKNKKQHDDDDDDHYKQHDDDHHHTLPVLLAQLHYSGGTCPDHGPPTTAE